MLEKMLAKSFAKILLVGLVLYGAVASAGSTAQGTDGNDVLQIGSAADVAIGGRGHDTFVYSGTPGQDVVTITDFDTSEDVLDLSSLASNIDPYDVDNYILLTGTPVGSTLVSWDKDGSGPGAPAQVCHLSLVPVVDLDSAYEMLLESILIIGS